MDHPTPDLRSDPPPPAAGNTAWILGSSPRMTTFHVSLGCTTDRSTQVPASVLSAASGFPITSTHSKASLGTTPPRTPVILGLDPRIHVQAGGGRRASKPPSSGRRSKFPSKINHRYPFSFTPFRPVVESPRSAIRYTGPCEVRRGGTGAGVDDCRRSKAPAAATVSPRGRRKAGRPGPARPPPP